MWWAVNAGPSMGESSPGLLWFAAALLELQCRAEALQCQVCALGPQLASQM